MASSSPMPMEVEVLRNWSELPPELTSSILVRLGTVEILENAQRVCKAWRRVSKEDPSIWRKIDMQGRSGWSTFNGGMCRNAVDRSQGSLVEINIRDSGSDSLLNHIADRSSNLRSLSLEIFTGLTIKGVVNAITKLPLLEELEVLNLWGKLDIKAIGNSCPKLKTLKLHRPSERLSRFRRVVDDDAVAISETMPQLHHLQLIANRLTDTGLLALLEKCPHLKHLDVRCCFNVKLSGDLEKRCLERDIDFRRPKDSTADYPYFLMFYDSDEDLDYFYGPYGGGGHLGGE